MVVCATDLPAWNIMLRVADALSHGEIPGRHVEWIRKETDGPVVFRLMRTSAGVSALRSELGKPDRTAVEWLLALCRYASGAQKPGDDACPVIRDLTRAGASNVVRPLLEALSVATTGELAALVEKGEADVGAGSTATTRRLRASRAPLPGMFDVTLVTRAGPDRQEEVGFVFDTLGIGPPDDEVIEAETDRDRTSGPRVTLHDPSNRESALGMTDLARSLESWARSTGRSVVAEVFLRDRASLPIISGAPDELLTAICRTFWCDWRKVGDVYIVWSKTWALDTIADVPEGRSAGWSADLDAGGERALLAFVSMARLSDAQLATAVRATGTANLLTSSTLKALRVLAALPQTTLSSVLTRRTRVWTPSPTVMSRVGDLLGEGVREPLWLRLRPDHDRSSYTLELTHGDRVTPAVVRLPCRRN